MAGDAVLDGRPSGVVLDLEASRADDAGSVLRSPSSSLSSWSSSTPNDSFPLATCFRFFFRNWGVETLCFDHQSLPFANLVPCIPILPRKDRLGSLMTLI